MEVDETPAGEDYMDRRILGRSPSGKVELTMPLFKAVGAVLSLMTIELMICTVSYAWVLRSSLNEMKLELSNTFLSKADGLTRLEYELRHKELERYVERVEKKYEDTARDIDSLRQRDETRQREESRK